MIRKIEWLVRTWLLNRSAERSLVMWAEDAELLAEYGVA